MAVWAGRQLDLSLKKEKPQETAAKGKMQLKNDKSIQSVIMAYFASRVVVLQACACFIIVPSNVHTVFWSAYQSGCRQINRNLDALHPVEFRLAIGRNWREAQTFTDVRKKSPFAVRATSIAGRRSTHTVFHSLAVPVLPGSTLLSACHWRCRPPGSPVSSQ